MARSYLVVGAVVLLTVGLAACAPLAPTGGELAPAAIVARAIEANGGDSWRRPRTLQLVGTATVYQNGLQANPQVLDDYRMYRVFPIASDAAHSANGKVRFDGFARGQHVFAISYDGRNTYNRDGLLEADVASATWSAAFGFGIIRFTDTPGFQLERLADDQVEGRRCYAVRVIDAEGRATLFAIDRQDFHIRRVGFDTPRGWHERIYSDFYWHRDPDFRQPGRVRLYYDGVLTRDIRWTDVKVNRQIADEVFVVRPQP